MPLDHDDIDDDDEVYEAPDKDDADPPRGWKPSAQTTQTLESNNSKMGASDSDTAKKAETLDNDRLDQAAERIQQIPGLQPENWAKLDEYGKNAVLNAAGRELQAEFHCPAPPLLTEDLDDENLLGSYGDGYQFDGKSGTVEGADYGIHMNSEGRVDREKLLGDDPSVALETYAHEFRHSYQHEQVNVNSKPQFRNMVDDLDRAHDWEGNFNEYKDPDEDFEAYRNQPVEQDARRFAQELVRRVYR